MSSDSTEFDNSIQNDELVDELRSLDEDQIISILTIGKKKLSHIKLQKMVFILSRLISRNTKAVPYKFGAFDEYLMEKIQSKDQDMIVSDNGKYALSQRGLKAYGLVRNSMEAKKPESVVLADALRKMSDDDLLAVSYYLYPESADKSEIKDRVNKRIEILTNKKKILKISEENGEIIIGVEE